VVFWRATVVLTVADTHRVVIEDARLTVRTQFVYIRGCDGRGHVRTWVYPVKTLVRVKRALHYAASITEQPCAWSGSFIKDTIPRHTDTVCATSSPADSLAAFESSPVAPLCGDFVHPSRERAAGTPPATRTARASLRV